MARDLKYKTKRNEWGVVISWVDVLNNYGNRAIVSTVTWGVFGIFLLFMLMAGVSGGVSLGAGFISVGVGALISFLLPLMLEPSWIEKKRSMTITPKAVTIRDKRYLLPSVTRIEYGTRGSWDMSEPKLKDRMQIRLWINDRHPIILSENSWTQSTNHTLHGNIQDELERYRRQETEPASEAPKPEQVNEFGMPDY